jgi:hypothetical protein
VLDRRSGGPESSAWDAITFQKLNGASTSTITVGLPDRTIDKFTGGILTTSFTSQFGTGGTLTGSGSS